MILKAHVPSDPHMAGVRPASSASAKPPVSGKAEHPDGTCVSPLDTKLEVFDRNATTAIHAIIEWLTEHPDDLIAVARGRHVEGHYRYEDKGLFEHSHQELLAEAAQELADAIVYLSRRIHLLES